MSRRLRVRAWSLACACAIVFAVAASAARPLGAVAQDPVQQQEPPAGGRGAGRGGQAAGPRPYAEVITAAARTEDGIFKVHRINDTLYYEIPKAQLDKDFLWNTHIKRTTIGAGFGGQFVGSRSVRWSQKGDRVLLLNIDYSIVADPSEPIARAVEDANYPAIIRTLPVAAYSPSGDPVVDVTALYMTDIPEFSARGAVGGRGVATDRTFFDRAVAFPENINVEVTMTYTGGAAEEAGRGGGGGGRGGGRAGMRGPSGTVVVHHSLIKLPDQPMMPRLFDERVGYATQELVDYGTEEHRSVQRRFIQRFRLDKKDPAAAVSEPVRPITFYIDSGTPKSMVPFVRRGIEAWVPAFEAAGFRNALVVREAPVGDPTWSAEDARHTVVRWVPSPEENSSYIHDPRSGEILSASVEVYPNIQNFGPRHYFVQAGAADKRAQQLPLPEDLQGELIRYYVTHQVGHVLGLTHNTKASSAYTIAQLRDPKHVRENGFTPSVMDESRFHYVAQPEDGIAPADLIPKVGPYDRFAIRWGYAPIPTARTPEAEKPTLDKWAREQESRPELRYSTAGQNNTDPGDAPGAVGASDSVAATGLGLKNLERVMGMLLKATGTKPGEPWDELASVYSLVVNHWSAQMTHVVRIVGGVESQQRHVGQTGDRFRTVPRARQTAAVQFLLDQAFQTPAFLIQPEVLRRIEPAGIVDRIRTAQTTVLTSLLQNQRLDRMTEQFTLDGAQAYPPLQLLMDLRAGIWSELAKPGTPVTLYRRNLHRAYLSQMDQKLNGTPAASAEIRAMVKGELRELDRQLQAALGAAGGDESTRRHFVDARDAIATILDPTVPRPAPAAAAPAGGRGGGGQ